VEEANMELDWHKFGDAEKRGRKLLTSINGVALFHLNNGRFRGL
jgi:hypothetical protein